jgi:hypothetical protein
VWLGSTLSGGMVIGRRTGLRCLGMFNHFRVAAELFPGLGALAAVGVGVVAWKRRK